jgi:hypothetical protein
MWYRDGPLAGRLGFDCLRGQEFSLLCNVHTDSEIHTASYPMGTRVYSPDSKVAGVSSWPLTFIKCWGQEWWNCTSTSQYVFMVWWTGTILPFILVYSSMTLQPFVGPWPLLQFRNHSYTDGRTPWKSDYPVARPLPTHRATLTQNKRTHRHPCLEWISNPWFRHSSERRQFML